MLLSTCSLVLFSFAVLNTVIEVTAAPDPIYNGMIDVGDYLSISIREEYVNGVCKQVVNIGKSQDLYELPCSGNTVTLNNNNVLIIGDLKGTNSAIFVDKNNYAETVLITDGRCLKIRYTNDSKRKLIRSDRVSERACKQLQKKILDEQNRNRIKWEKWQNDFEKRMNEMRESRQKYWDKWEMDFKKNMANTFSSNFNFFK